jgi:hypothetical protein
MEIGLFVNITMLQGQVTDFKGDLIINTAFGINPSSSCSLLTLQMKTTRPD